MTDLSKELAALRRINLKKRHDLLKKKENTHPLAGIFCDSRGGYDENGEIAQDTTYSKVNTPPDTIENLMLCALVEAQLALIPIMQNMHRELLRAMALRTMA